MALADLIARGVKIAKNVTDKNKISVTVQHEAWLGTFTVKGAPNRAAAVPRKAIVEELVRAVQMTSTAVARSEHQVTFLEPAAVTKHDKITLPGGETGPILSVGGLADGRSPVGATYYAEVLMGF